METADSMSARILTKKAGLFFSGRKIYRSVINKLIYEYNNIKGI